MNYLPHVWPWFCIPNIIRFDPLKPKPTTTNDPLWIEIFKRFARVFIYIVLAYAGYVSFVVTNGSITTIVARDLCFTFSLYGGWHYLLYESKYAIKLRTVKYNQEQFVIDTKCLRHDVLYSAIGTIISSLMEVILFNYANRYLTINIYYDLMNWWSYSLFWFVFLLYYRTIWFYITHRMFHPWHKTFAWFFWCLDFRCYDLGLILFNKFHYIHHKSHVTNMGPWTGLSMHPVEHILAYFSCILPYLLFVSLHPLHFYFIKYHTSFTPLIAHDGFDAPCGSTYFHYLHHKYLNCNYGALLFPVDMFFQTYVAEECDVDKLKRN